MQPDTSNNKLKSKWQTQARPWIKCHLQRFLSPSVIYAIITISACSFSCKTSSFPSSSLLVSFSGNVGCLLLVVTCTSDRHGGGLREVRLICFRACGCGIHTRSRLCLFCWPGHAPAGKNLLHTLCIVPKFVVCVVLYLRSVVNFEALNTVYWRPP